MNSHEELLKRLKESKGLLLIFDFDGTLVNIASTPDSIELFSDLKLLLRRLLSRGLTNVAIISGRSIGDLQEYIPKTIPLALAGCHGCQIQMPGEVEESVLDDEDIQRDLDAFAVSLDDMADWPGIIIEHKGCAVALHYRMADSTTVEHAREEFYSRAEMLPTYDEMEVIEGKKVLELRPSGMNKGIAVSFLVESFKPSGTSTAVYFGDDTTDLDAFAALPDDAIRVAVGRKIAEQADYVLANPSEVIELIRGLLK